MRRERALKIVLVAGGLLFTAGVVPLTMFFSREPAVPMIMSIYVTLGIFLLLAVRDPAANRSLIAFGADRAGSGEVSQAGIGSRRIGSQSGKCESVFAGILGCINGQQEEAAQKRQRRCGRLNPMVCSCSGLRAR